MGNYCKSVSGHCSSAFGYIQSTRPYQGLAWVGQKLQVGAVKVLDFVLPKNEMTNRREFRFIPVFVENALGSVSYDGLCPKAKVSKKEKLNAKVQAVFDRLIAKCPRKNMKWEVRVMKDDDTVNAFCLPGGKTVITTGMIKKLKETYQFDHEFTDLTFEDNLAAVMGHEIVHAAAGHGARSLQLKMILFLVGKIFSYILPFFLFKKKPAEKPAVTVEERRKEEAEQKEVENKRSAFSSVVDFLFKLGGFLFKQHHSQCHELESDRFGIKLAHEAGFNTQASVRLQHIFLEMQGKKDGDRTGLLEKSLSVLSTHPASQARLDANRATIQAIEEKGIEAAFA